MKSRLFSAFLLTFLWVGVSLADFPSPRLDRIFPLGAAQGASVEVEIQGADLEEPKELFFDHPGIRAKHIKEKKFQVTVDPQVPLGTYDCRFSGKYGFSNPRLFAISSGFKEVLEKEPNDTLEQAQALGIDTIVHGTSDNGREDIFSFRLAKGQRVTISCNAERLDSQLDAVLALTDSIGKPLASNSDYDGRDPFLDFVPPLEGIYFVKLNDLSFRGGQPYRLVISCKPQVEMAIPRAVQGDRETQVTLLGRNLGPSARSVPFQLNDLPLEAMDLKIRPPASLLSLGQYRFLEHPTTHSVLPTAATCTLNGFQELVMLNQAPVITPPILVSKNPVVFETEPNDSVAQAQRLSLPAVVSGGFGRERDGDWFEFEATETGPNSLEVYCERIAGRADPYAVLYDDKKNKVTELDDYGHRMNSFDGHLRDPSGQVNLTAGKKYALFVQDRYQRGGARYQYVLTVQKQEFDFHIAGIHSQNPGPAGLNLRKGGASWLNLVIHQRGPNTPITVRAEGLPPGVHTQTMTQRNNSNGLMVFWADADAKESLAPIRLVAKAITPQGEIEREVRPYTRVWSENNISSSRPTRQQWLGVKDSAAFALEFDKPQAELKAGEKLEMTVKLRRLHPEFKSQVTLQTLEFPNSIKMGNVVIPAEKNEAKVVLEAQANCQPGEYSIVISGQSQVPFSKDDGKAGKGNILVTQPSRPLTLNVLQKK